MKFAWTKLHMDREIAIVLALFAFSCIHAVTLLISLFALLFYLRRGAEGALKALILIALRTPMSSVIASSFSSVSVLKYFVIFIFNIYLICKYEDVLPQRRTVVNTVLILTAAFSGVAMLGAVLNSAYPVTSIFKILSYAVTFSAVIIGLAGICDVAKLLDFSVTVFLPVLLLSLFVFNMPNFRTHGTLFQGLLNHPNMFGIMAALFLCAYCIRKQMYGKGNVWVIAAIFVMTFWSGSRTAMLTEVVVFLFGCTYFFPKNVRRIRILMLLLLIALLVTMTPGVWTATQNFLYKGHEENVLYSREGQQSYYEAKFRENPLLGCGLNVPYLRGVYDTRLRFDLVVEPGNLIWALLGDCGILGSGVFAIFLFYVLFARGRVFQNRIILYLAPLMICMGEMVFFSVNSIAPLLYILLGCYLFLDDASPLPTQ